MPLVFFGQKMPKLYSLFGWLKVFIVAELYIQTGYKYQAVVLELAVDHPGDMEYFKEHLHVDYGVLTAIAPEHMENFKDLDNFLQGQKSDIQFSYTNPMNMKKYLSRGDKNRFGIFILSKSFK